MLVTGSKGQLGWELSRTCPANIKIYPVDIGELDISNGEKVERYVSDLQPNWIINAAAYTAVDKAEQESEIAYRVNRDGAENLALSAKRISAKLIQISTDFVFDGKKSSPYLSEDKPNPLCVYGASKQAGDEAVLSILGQQATIIRTAWVYSSHGNNFVKTMLKLMSEREELGIVADQIGTPTWANGLAKAIWSCLELDEPNNSESKIYHWTDAGVSSWYDFAIAIQEEATQLGLLHNDKDCKVYPIRTEDYPTPAKRPAYSVMDKTHISQATNIQTQHWRAALRKMLAEL